MAGPGGTVWMDGIMTMSNTRRQAWAALHAPGTRWLDITNKTEGYISNGECVPTTPKLVTDVRQSAGQVFTNSATPVNAVTTGAIAARPGGSRRIRVTMQGHLTTDTFGSGFNESVRLYLAGSGIPDVTSSIYSEIQQRLVSDTIGALSRVTVNATFEGTAAAGFQIDLNVLREGGNASVAWVYCEYGRLVVWDMGPA
jgi:hypothetical protein